MRSTSDGRIAMNAGVGLGLEADSASCQHNEHGKIKPQDKLLAAQVSIANGTIGLGACLVICKTFILELPCEGAAMYGTSICREAKITAFSASCQSAEGCQQ